MLAEHVQNLLDGTALLGTGIKLAVGIGACPTLAKAVVALAIHLLRLGYQRQILLTFTNVLATF